MKTHTNAELADLLDACDRDIERAGELAFNYRAQIAQALRVGIDKAMWSTRELAAMLVEGFPTGVNSKAMAPFAHDDGLLDAVVKRDFAIAATIRAMDLPAAPGAAADRPVVPSISDYQVANHMERLGVILAQQAQVAQTAAGIIRSLAVSYEPRPALAPEDVALLIRLARDTRHDSTHEVVERDPELERCLRLSDAGLIACEQHARGIIPHITRLGLRRLRELDALPREVGEPRP